MDAPLPNEPVSPLAPRPVLATVFLRATPAGGVGEDRADHNLCIR
jgi:hypothetical protein